MKTIPVFSSYHLMIPKRIKIRKFTSRLAREVSDSVSNSPNKFAEGNCLLYDEQYVLLNDMLKTASCRNNPSNTNTSMLGMMAGGNVPTLMRKRKKVYGSDCCSESEDGSSEVRSEEWDELCD